MDDNLKRVIHLQKEAEKQQIVRCEVDQFYERILNCGIDVDKERFTQLVEAFNKEQRTIQSGGEVNKIGLQVCTLSILVGTKSESVSCEELLKKLNEMGKYKSLYEGLYS